MSKIKADTNFPMLRSPEPPAQDSKPRMPRFSRRKLWQSQEPRESASVRNVVGQVSNISPRQDEGIIKYKIAGIQSGRNSQREALLFPLLRPKKNITPTLRNLSHDANHTGLANSFAELGVTGSQHKQTNLNASAVAAQINALGGELNPSIINDFNTIGTYTHAYKDESPINRGSARNYKQRSATNSQLAVSQPKYSIYIYIYIYIIVEDYEHNMVSPSSKGPIRKVVYTNLIKDNASIKVKIETLEDRLKDQIHVIDTLKEENAIVKKEYLAMKEINKKLLKSIPKASLATLSLKTGDDDPDSPSKERNMGDVHSLYQDLYLADLRKEIEKTKIESRSNRLVASENKRDLDFSKRENHKLLAVIKRYRKMISDLNVTFRIGTNRKSPNAYGLRSPEPSRLNLNRSLSPDMAGDYPDGEPPKTPKDANSISTGKIKLLKQIMEFVKTSNNIPEIFAKTLKVLPELIPFNKVGIFVLAKDLLSSNKSAGVVSLDEGVIQKSVCLRQPCDVISDLDINIPEPIVASLDQCRSGVKTKEAIGLGAFSQKSTKICYFYLQLERKKTKGQAFTKIDDMLLRILCNILGFRFDNKINETTIENKDRSIRETLNIFIQLSSQRTMIKLVNKCRDLLPAYLGYRDFGVLLYDTKNMELYSLYESIGSEVAQAIRYPTGIGITGELLKKPQIRISNDVRRESKFNNDIDNIHNIPNLSSFLFAPIYSFNNRLLGFVQVLGKTSGDIYKTDIENFAPIQRLIGLLVEKISEMTITMNLTLGFRSTLLALLNLSKDTSEDQDYESVMSISLLGKTLEHLDGLVGNISSSNKGAENVLLYGESFLKKEKEKTENKQPKKQTIAQKFAQFMT